MFVEDETSGGQFVEDDYDNDNDSASVEEQGQDNADNQYVPSDEGDSKPKTNPAWEPVLSKLPEAYRREILPELDAWDKNYQARDEMFAPYRGFIDKKIDPSSIEDALSFSDLVRSNPRSVFEALHKQFNFGYDLFPAQGGPGDEEEEDEDLDNEDSDEYESPAMAELRATVSALSNQEEARKQEAMQAQARETVQNEFNEVENRLGRALSENEFNMIVSIANGMDEISVSKAADQMFSAGYLRPRSAPETHNGNGSPAPKAVKLGSRDDEDNILSIMQSMGLARKE